MRRPIVVACSLLVAGCGHREVEPANERARPVRVATPSSPICVAAPRFSGNVQPLARVDLAFKRGGYVAEVLRVTARPGGLLDEGDQVKQGTVLARLRVADYQVKLGQARAQLTQALAAERQAQQDLERASQVFAGGGMSKAMVEGAENKVAASAGQTQAARLLVQEAQLALEDCALVAPRDAVVVKRMVEPGNLVGPGSPGFILVDDSSMKVTFGVPDVMLERVKVGTRLEVLVDALGQAPISAEVSRVAPVADLRTRLFEIEVLLPNPERKLRPGMIAALHLQDTRPTTSRSVPVSAVVRPPGETTGFAVFVAEGDELTLRAIEPGELCGSTVEVRQGLDGSERVVVEGAATAFVGERVTVVP